MILDFFHVDNNEGQSVIGYDMIVGRDLILQLGLLAKFKYPFFQCDGATVPMKEPSGLLWQTYITSCEMYKLVMHNEEPVYTRRAT